MFKIPLKDCLYQTAVRNCSTPTHGEDNRLSDTTTWRRDTGDGHTKLP